MSGQQEKLKVVVAGTSFAGAVQIPVFQSHARTQVVAVCSGRPERAKATADTLGVPAHYTQFEEMLDRERPDLVCVSTPTDLHYPMARMALERNVHVLCEKPFALDQREAAAMTALADRTPVVSMIDFEFRFLPARRYLMELLQQGYLGDVRMVEFHQRRPWRLPTPTTEWDWWADASRGGGLLGALASHMVDSFRLWMGEIRRVFCDLTVFEPKRGGRSVTADDSFTLIAEFASGARAVSQMTGAAGVNDARIALFGTAGQLVIPNVGTEIWGCRTGEEFARLEIPERYRLPEEPRILRAPFRVLLNHMVDAIDSGRPSPSPNFADGLASQKILDAARRSSAEGRWMDVL